VHARAFVPGVEGVVGDEPHLRVGVDSTEIPALIEVTLKAGHGRDFGRVIERSRAAVDTHKKN